jgi:hypothetical protein
MLGLCLRYLKAMHPIKPTQHEEATRVSAHIISLFLNDPLVNAVVPNSNPASATPAKELNALQIRLVSLENTLTNLAKATTKVRKEIKQQPTTTSQHAKASATTSKPVSTPPTYAAKAAAPQRPMCGGGHCHIYLARQPPAITCKHMRHCQRCPLPPLLTPKPLMVSMKPTRWVFPLYGKWNAGTIVEYAPHETTSH